MRRERAEQLLLEIARCPVALDCLSGGIGASPCGVIVGSQKASASQPFQVPEPWSGDVTKAFILFISSNPSISQEEEYPTLQWSDGEIADYFMNRFGGGQRPWIRDGAHALRKDGSYSRGTAFWRFVRNRATELLQRPAAPGIDYALTEVVRCKSEGEVGVASAAKTCSDLYLERTIDVARAPVLVVLGSWARAMVGSLVGMTPTDNSQLFGPVKIGQRERLIAFLPHPNARQNRTFSTFPGGLLEQLRRSIEAEE